VRLPGLDRVVALVRRLLPRRRVRHLPRASSNFSARTADVAERFGEPAPEPAESGDPGLPAEAERSRAYPEQDSAPLCRAPELYGGILTGTERRATQRTGADGDSADIVGELAQLSREPPGKPDLGRPPACRPEEQWRCVSYTFPNRFTVGLCSTKQESYLAVGVAEPPGWGAAIGCHPTPDALMGGLSATTIGPHKVGMGAIVADGAQGLAFGTRTASFTYGISFTALNEMRRMFVNTEADILRVHPTADY
jgi:hypothetical protein